MICKAGVFQDSSTTFRRFVEDCQVRCEVITPHLLAAPFFRGSYVTIIIPTGFANPKYSLFLPVLRAKADRIRTFLERGGRLLVFGAAEARPDAYDWLPFQAEYHHDYGEREVILPEEWGLGSLLEGYDLTAVPCDGTFTCQEGDIAGFTREGRMVLLGKRVGEGVVIITSLHEYPSRKFLKEFACGDTEIPF